MMVEDFIFKYDDDNNRVLTFLEGLAKTKRKTYCSQNV